MDVGSVWVASVLVDGRCDGCTGNSDGYCRWWLIASALCCMAEMTMVILVMNVGWYVMIAVGKGSDG